MCFSQGMSLQPPILGPNFKFIPGFRKKNFYFIWSFNVTYYIKHKILLCISSTKSKFLNKNWIKMPDQHNMRVKCIRISLSSILKILKFPFCFLYCSLWRILLSFLFDKIYLKCNFFSHYKFKNIKETDE